MLGLSLLIGHVDCSDFREGLTKFGASNKEITASCPWRSNPRNKAFTLKEEISDENGVPMDPVEPASPPQTDDQAQSEFVTLDYGSVLTMPVQEDVVVSPDVSDVVAAIASIQQPQSGSEDNGNDTQVVVVVDVEIENEAATDTDVKDSIPECEVEVPPVQSEPVGKSPFVSLNHLSKLFDQLCRVNSTENCKLLFS